MADHFIFFGGQRTRQLNLAMLPSVPPRPDDVMETDNRKGPVLFSNTRWIALGTEQVEARGCNGCGSAECSESMAIVDYVRNNPIEDGDCLYTHIIPRFTEARSIWWMVDRPLTGVTATISFVDSTNLVTANVIPVVHPDNPLNLSNAGSGIIHLPRDGSFYFRQNGLMRICLTGVPQPPELDPNCWDFRTALHDLSLFLSPEVYEPCRGVF